MRKPNQPKVVDSYRTSPIGTQKTKKKKKNLLALKRFRCKQFRRCPIEALQLNQPNPIAVEMVGLIYFIQKYMLRLHFKSECLKSDFFFCFKIMRCFCLFLFHPQQGFLNRQCSGYRC